jgi:hypothetical protein
MLEWKPHLPTVEAEQSGVTSRSVIDRTSEAQVNRHPYAWRTMVLVMLSHALGFLSFTCAPHVDDKPSSEDQLRSLTM